MKPHLAGRPPGLATACNQRLEFLLAGRSSGKLRPRIISPDSYTMAVLPMANPRFLACLLVASWLGLAAPAGAHENPAEETPRARPEAIAEPSPIPASEIPARAESALALLRGVAARLAPLPQITQVEEELAAVNAEVERLSEAQEMQALDELSLRGLYGLKLRWQAIGTRLNDWQRLVSARAQTLTEQARQVEAQKNAWGLTLENRQQARLPDALVDQVRNVLNATTKQEQSVREKLDNLLTLVSRISELSVQVANAVGAIEDAEQANRGRLLVRDSDPLWTALLSRSPADEETAKVVTPDLEDAEGVLGDELSSAWSLQIDAVTTYLEKNGDRLLVHVLIFVGLAGLLVLLDRRRARWPKLEGKSEVVVDVVSHPVATAALIALFMTRYLYPGAPLALFDIARLLLVIPILVLLSRAFPERRRFALYALLSLFVMDVLRGLLQTQPLSSRVFLLVVTGLGLFTMIRAVGLERSVMVSAHGPWQQMWRLFSLLSVPILTASIIANVAGILGLAELLGEATILSIFVGFGLYAFTLVLMGLLDLFLQSPGGRRVRAFRRNPDLIHRRVGRVLNMVAIVTWLISVLVFFKIWGAIWSSLVWLFSASLSLGTFEISLWDILAFVVAIWLGIQVSRFIRFILNEDVFTRVTLPRGVPATIGMMVNYTLVTIAFFIALAVAGFDLSRFAIIAGALSVGIGFGLQNVVNNFVSGLILAFERPISVGDSVEVGTLWGRVNRIGIRSSVVRTFDGSEVIVPNADFISKEVINWTLSDVSRRLIVPVGVAYGSDPHQVLDLLVRVARDNPDVMTEPEPYGLFIGFGDSSLDFELRAWCDFNDGMRVKTELNLGIHDALKEAGIEIPFPQRDLHLRSVDGEAGRALSGREHRAPRLPDQRDETPAPAADTSSIPPDLE